MSTFQTSTKGNHNIFDIPNYNVLRKFMLFMGQDPHQSDGIRNIIVFFMVSSVLGVLIPSFLEIGVELRKKNMDAVIECLANCFAAAASVVKLLNIHINRENFKEMYDLITREWMQLKVHELHVLEDVTAQGSRIAQIYRSTLLSFLGVFLMVPLLCPALDVVLPLNETRPRQQVFRVNYIIFDNENYFFYVYLQLAWAAIVLVMTIVTVDSLYMIIIHHSSGLFAVCSYRMKKATEYKGVIIDNINSENYMDDMFKRCIITHNKAIEFHDILSKSSRNSYLIQVGLNMCGISVTAVQTVLCLDRPEEALRFALFLVAQQFHLFIITLPGQALLDHCNALMKDIYCSTWYRVPVKFQKVIYMMQIRSLTPCELTAGGLYKMNMENFATTFKMSMSYFTMLMSLRE